MENIKTQSQTKKVKQYGIQKSVIVAMLLPLFPVKALALALTLLLDHTDSKSHFRSTSNTIVLPKNNTVNTNLRSLQQKCIHVPDDIIYTECVAHPIDWYSAPCHERGYQDHGWGYCGGGGQRICKKSYELINSLEEGAPVKCATGTSGKGDIFERDTLFRCTNGERRRYPTRDHSYHWDQDWPSKEQEVDCRKIPEGDAMFLTCGSLSLNEFSSVIYQEGLWKSHGRYQDGTEATINCEHDPFWYPVKDKSTCRRTNWDVIGPVCKCERCSNLPQTPQTNDETALVQYVQNPPAPGIRCEAGHPVDTTVKVTCKYYPWLYPTKEESGSEIKCRPDENWSNLIDYDDEDYCQCAVQCSGFCLGVGRKTSITHTKFEWEDTNILNVSWLDGCSDTNDSSYTVDIQRSYWVASKNEWSKEFPIGMVNRDYTKFDDLAVESEAPDGLPYVPGLRIKYTWHQKTIVGSYSPNYITSSEDGVTAEITLPFIFRFTYLLTSPDGSVDIEGATLKIIDVEEGTIFHALETGTRGHTSTGKKEDPELITVQLPSWISTVTRQVKVTLEYVGHDIICDEPLCTEGQRFWIGDITHNEEINLFFTDLSVVTITGTVKNQNCPVENVNFRVISSVGEKENVESFPAASNALGEYKIYGPLGKVQIEPYLDSHIFKYELQNNNIYIAFLEDDVTGLDFTDITTRKLTVNLVGGNSGCNASLGVGFANLQVASGCYNNYFKVGQEPASFDIPSLNFNLKLDVFNTNENYQWQWEGDKEFQNFEEYMIATKQYNNLGWRNINADFQDQNVTFRYHPVVTDSDINVNMMNGATNIMSGCDNINAKKKSGNETFFCDEEILPDDEGNLWFFESSTPKVNQTITFEIKETYGDKYCQAQGFVRLSENWSSDSTYIKSNITLDEDGVAKYEFSPGLPEFGCPFTKLLFYEFITVDNALSELEAHDEVDFISKYNAKAIIEGEARAFDQNMHVTSPESIIPLMILRDPPGANSFSSVTKSRAVSIETSMKAAFGGGTDDEGKSGFGIGTIKGLGFMTTAEWEVTSQGGLKITRTQTKDAKNIFSVETTKTFTSSTDPSLTGKYGDVIVGLGVTTTIRPAYRLRWNSTSCTAVSTKTIVYETGIKTEQNDNLAIYSYSHWYIENVIIPELRQIEYNDESDSIEIADATRTRENWRIILREKDQAVGIDPFGESGAIWDVFEQFVNTTDSLWDEVKDDGLLSLTTINTIASGAAALAAFVASMNIGGMIKFSVTAVAEMAAGWTYTQDQVLLKERYDQFKKEYLKFKTDEILRSEDGTSTTRLTVDGGHIVSGSSATSRSTSRTVEFNFDLENELGTWAKTDIEGLAAESSSKLTSQMEINQVHTDFSAVNTIFDWTIHDPDIGDHYLIDIKEDQLHGSPMFHVLSGRSLCRHEENTVPRQGVEILVEDETERTNLRPKEPAVFIVKLRHTGYDPIHPWYNVRLVRSAMKGMTGLITFAGHPLTNFIEFTNLEKDEWVEIELVVHRSYTSYFFENLTLEIYSQCEDEFSRNQMPTDIIHDTVSVSATWIQPCAEAEIMPNADFVSIKHTSVSPFPVEIFNPTHQVNPWHNIEDLELRLVWKVWTPDDSASVQYSKQNGIDIVKTQENLKEERSQKTSILWNTEGLNDGKYALQVEAKCPNRSPEYNSPKVVYIHKEELQVAGYPQPRDGGEYSFDEDIVVSFNRDLNCFNPTMNIKVESMNDPTYDVPMHMLCDRNTIIAMPTISADWHRLAGEDLRITLFNVMDFAGNYLNSYDGESTYNGITWVVRAQKSDNLSTLSARLSLCIDDKIVIDASESQLNQSKTALKKNIHETFDYLGGIHTCRFSVSNPYYFDSTCPNGRWDLIIQPSHLLSNECRLQTSDGNVSVHEISPIEIVEQMDSSVSDNNMTLYMIDLTKPIGVTLTSFKTPSQFPTSFKSAGVVPSPQLKFICACFLVNVAYLFDFY